MADGNRHPSGHQAGAARSERASAPVLQKRVDLNKILKNEPSGDFKVVGDRKHSAFRINGICEKLPHFNVTENPKDPRKHNRKPQVMRTVPPFVTMLREVNDTKVVSLIALKADVTTEMLYIACNQIFRRKMEHEGLTIYRTVPPVNMAYIQFKTEADRINFVKKYNYCDICAPTGFHPDDTYGLKISHTYYKETGKYLVPPTCAVNVADILPDLHRQLPYYESYPLPSDYYEYVKLQEAHKHFKQPKTPEGTPPPTSSDSEDEGRRRREKHRSYSNADHERRRERSHSPDRNRRRHRSSSEESSRSRHRYHHTSSRSRRYRSRSPRHRHSYRERYSRSPVRRNSNNNGNPDHQLPIGERLQRIVARQSTSTHDHNSLKPVFSSIPPDLTRSTKPVPLKDIWNNCSSKYEPQPVTRQPKEVPVSAPAPDPATAAYYAVMAIAMDTMTERIRDSAETAFKSAIYKEARVSALAAFEKERQELIKNPPPKPEPKPKPAKSVLPLTTQKLSEIGPIPKKLSDLGRIPKIGDSKKHHSDSRNQGASTSTAYSLETTESTPKKEKRIKESTSSKDRLKESASKYADFDKESTSKKEQLKEATPKTDKLHEDSPLRKDERPKESISKPEKPEKESSSKKDKHQSESSSKKDRRHSESVSKKDKHSSESTSKKEKHEKESASNKEKHRDSSVPEKEAKKKSVSTTPRHVPEEAVIVPPSPAKTSEPVSVAEPSKPTVSSKPEKEENRDPAFWLKKLEGLRHKVGSTKEKLNAATDPTEQRELQKKLNVFYRATKKVKSTLKELSARLNADEDAARIAAEQRKFEEKERHRREAEEQHRKEALEAARKRKEEREAKKREEEERKRKLLEQREQNKREAEARRKAEADALARKKREDAAKKKRKSKKKETSESSSSSDSSDDEDDSSVSIKKEATSDNENKPSPSRRRKVVYRSISSRSRDVSSSSTSLSSDASFAYSYGGGIGGTDYSSDSDYEPDNRPAKSELNRKRGPPEATASSSGPSIKKVKLELEPTVSAPNPKPEVPEIWHFDPMDTMYHYNLGIDDLKPYVQPVGSMLTPKFWKRREPPNDEILPRDFFVIPDPIPKPGTGAKMRYSKRTPLEEYLTTLMVCKAPLDEEEIMYMEMATNRTKALGELPFPYAYEWRPPAYEPDPEQFPEPVEKNHILEHYVDPNLTLLAPIREGAIRVAGLVRYSRLEKVAIRRLIVKPRLTITDDDRQMVKNIQEEYRTENTLLRKLKTAGLADCSFLTSNALTSRPTCVTFAPSRIHDWGLYTLEDIKPKSMIIEYIGEVCRSTVVDAREARYMQSGIGSSYLFRINDDWVIDATRMGNCARFINHSCTPNSYARVVKNKHIAIYSKRFIEAGEEITYDYKFPLEDKKIPCFCNAHNCRGSLN